MKLIFFLTISLQLMASNINILPYMQFDINKALSFLPQEYKDLKQTALKQQKQNKETYTIIYFFSDSVPPSSFGNLLIETAKYNRNHSHHLGLTQVLIGMDPDLKQYLLNLRKYLNGLNSFEKEESLINIRMAPTVFSKYHIKTVPALALAKCNSKVHPSECEILTLVKGDVSLSYFFSLMKDNNLLPRGL